MSTSAHDVVIAGGGPSGCATALFLWHADPSLRDRIVVLDRAEFPRDKICAGAIGGRAEKLLASIGVQVRVPGVEVRGLGVVTGDRRLVTRSDRPVGRVVRRREFDAALLEEVRARGIAVRTGVGVTGFTRRSNDVAIETTDGPTSARVLIGADGVGSVVRRAMGLERGALYAQAVEVDTPRVATDRDDDVLWFDLSDRRYPGYGWSFPTLVGNERLVCRGVYRVTRGVAGSAETAPDVAALLEADLSRLGVPEAQGWNGFKRFAERGLAPNEPSAFDGVLLVGEAAGIDPVLGEGIAQAILYGRTAGEYVASCLRRNDRSFRDWPRAFRASRIGFDLRARRFALPWVYGRRRPLVEDWVGSSDALARAGLRYFAGEHVDRGDLVRAAWDLACTLGRTRGGATASEVVSRAP